jgi:hypothetical protein
MSKGMNSAVYALAGTRSDSGQHDRFVRHGVDHVGEQGIGRLGVELGEHFVEPVGDRLYRGGELGVGRAVRGFGVLTGFDRHRSAARTSAPPVRRRRGNHFLSAP